MPYGREFIVSRGHRRRGRGGGEVIQNHLKLNSYSWIAPRFKDARGRNDAMTAGHFIKPVPFEPWFQSLR